MLAETFFVSLISINNLEFLCESFSLKFSKSFPNASRKKSEGAVMFFKLMSYPSLDSIIIFLKSL